MNLFNENEGACLETFIFIGGFLFFFLGDAKALRFWLLAELLQRES